MASLFDSYGLREWLSKTHFSFLRGASAPKDLVNTALEFGYGGLGVADYDGVYGLARTYTERNRLVQASAQNLDLYYGAELHLQPDHDLPLVLQDTLVVYALTKRGYQNLCKLVSRMHEVSKDRAFLSLEDVLASDVQDLVAIQPMRGCMRVTDFDGTRLGLLKDHFQSGFYLAASRHLHPFEDHWLGRVFASAKHFDLPVLFCQDAFFHRPEQKVVQDLLNVIRTNTSFETCTEHFFPTAQRCLHTAKDLEKLWSGLPGFAKALQASHELALQFDFDLNELRYHYPHEMIPEGHTAQSFLEELTMESARDKHPHGIPESILKKIQNEFQIIKTLNFADYFLTVWDIVRWARSQNIVCQGRGSAANSTVCFYLGITNVNPEHFDLLFERFVSLERGDPPDIDVDFEHERREEVIQYIYRRFGRKRAAMVANVITYQRKGALRAVGKAFGLQEQTLKVVSDFMRTPRFRSEPTEELFSYLQSRPEFFTHEKVHIPWKLWCTLADRIYEFPRHLGIHSGGFMISDHPLDELLPQEPATMEDRTVVQWCKEDIEALGFFKIDVLALGMLSAVRKMFGLMRQHHDVDMDLSTLPKNDDATYHMIQKGDTVGVFQIESRAQMSMLVRLKPKSFYDLVIEVAIVRPGPIQGKIVHPFLERRDGKVPITYPHPKLEPILRNTLGVALFQEQVMRVAIAVGDFTAGEANELRKNIGVWNAKGFVRNLSPWLIKLERGMQAHGIAQFEIDRLMNHMKGFAHYGFPESHAISFAHIAYASSYLKCHFPAAFFAGLLNSLPMGFYSPHALLQGAKRAGVKSLPLSVLHSDWDHLLEPHKTSRQEVGIRLGLRLVEGLSESAAQRMLLMRSQKTWQDFEDFVFRSGLHRDDFVALAAANAFQDFGWKRAEALWFAQAIPTKTLIDDDDQALDWQPEDKWERMRRDFRSFHTSLAEHPVSIIKNEMWVYEPPLLELKSSRDLRSVKNGKMVTVFGMILVKQAPGSAKGMVFYTLEDEKGFVNLAFTPQVYRKYFEITEPETFLCVRGVAQKEGEYHSILVKHVFAPERLSERMRGLKGKFRSFGQKALPRSLFQSRDYG